MCSTSGPFHSSPLLRNTPGSVSSRKLLHLGHLSLQPHFPRRVSIPPAYSLQSSGDFWKPSPLLVDSRPSLSGSDCALAPTQPGHSGIQETMSTLGHGDTEKTGEPGETWGQEVRAERAAASAAQANVKAFGGLPWWASG